MKKIQVTLIDDSDWKNVYRTSDEFEVSDNFSSDEIDKKIEKAVKEEKETNDEYTDESVFEKIGKIEGFKKGSFDVEYLEFSY